MTVMDNGDGPKLCSHCSLEAALSIDEDEVMLCPVIPPNVDRVDNSVGFDGVHQLLFRCGVAADVESLGDLDTLHCSEEHPVTVRLDLHLFCRGQGLWLGSFRLDGFYFLCWHHFGLP